MFYATLTSSLCLPGPARGLVRTASLSSEELWGQDSVSLWHLFLFVP